MIAILAVATCVRLWRLDLMEFKADEAGACQLAYQVPGGVGLRGGAGSNFPLTGLMASIGVPNPPLFVYLLALPLFLSAEPLSAAMAVALSNVAAVGLCYMIGRRYFSPFVALAASALYALAPWAVIFSRKIWAQDLLPIFVGGFLLAAHAFIVDRKPRALVLLVVLAAAAVQLHFSALILVAVLAYLLVVGRTMIRARWLAIGAAGALLLYAPYLLHIMRTHGGDFANLGGRRTEWSGSLAPGQRLLLMLRYPLSVSGADGTDVLIGWQPGIAFPFALATGLAGFAGLIWLCVRERSTPVFSARLMLVAWFVLPTLGIAIAGVAPYTHYFIILYPLSFLGLAATLEELGRRWRPASFALLALCLAGYAWMDATLFHDISAHGGAPADYGTAYAHKAAAIDFVAAENPGRPFILMDGVHPNGAMPSEYRFLADLKTRGRQEAARNPAFAYVLIDSLKSALTPAGKAVAKDLRRREFGPLAVYVVPLRPQ